MKRAIYREFGHPAKVLELVEEESPDLEPGQARIEVLRSPINPSDYIQVAGEYGVRPDLPATAGNEGIGRVTEVNGDGIAVGQLVLLPIGDGAWRTELVGQISHLVPMPEGDIDQLSNPPQIRLSAPILSNWPRPRVSTCVAWCAAKAPGRRWKRRVRPL